ncbi:MAG: hypothetical protein KBA97_10925 [Methanothrix sp.]|nr:hypothetical protein [Methanothrix sp.]
MIRAVLDSSVLIKSIFKPLLTLSKDATQLRRDMPGAEGLASRSEWPL